MNQNLIYILSDEDQGVISDAIRGFFAGILRFLYNWIGSIANAMYRFANNDYLGLGSLAENFASKIFSILIIFMIFKLTITFLTYLINPDTFSDSNKGVQNVIKRIIISFVLLVSINPIFETLFTIQQSIIDDAVIDNLLLGSNNDKIYITDEGERIYFTQMSKFCEEYEPGKRIVTFTKGEHLALLTLKPFMQPVSENEGNIEKRKEELRDLGYCGTDVSSLDGIAYVDTDSFALSQAFDGIKDTSGLLRGKLYNGTTGKWSLENNVYLIDFNYFIALIVGIFVALILITYCFDIVIRACTLMLMQVLAPIPIISYISPGGKSSDMLSNWGKKLMTTWASLFVRILSLDLGLTIISSICESGGIGDDDMGLLMKTVIILGVLMFAKKLPQLIEELFPGLKLGGMKLNPFKRIREDALGGNGIMNAAGRTVGGLSGAVGGAIAGRRAGSEIGKKGLGTLLGAASGMSSGFRNKKWSFGHSMNDVYKNLTGNEFRRMTPTSMLLPKLGAGEVGEAKKYIGAAYSKLNSRESDLNISESQSAALAQELSSKGYDYRNHNGMIQESNKRISDLLNSNGVANEDGLLQQLSVANANMTNMNNNYKAAQTAYENEQQNVARAKADVENARNKITDIDSQIDGLRSKMNNSRIESERQGIQAKIDQLQNDKTVAENSVKNLGDILNNSVQKLNDAKVAMDLSHSELETASSDYNAKLDDYNKLQSYKEERKVIDNYISNRQNEDKIRSDISNINKDIETLKKEKAQRERFYRVDPAPQQDYESAKNNITNKYN